MRIPLQDYLTKKRENLKVFRLTAELCRTPVDIDIGSFVRNYGFNSFYDRFRAWFTIARFEGKHIVEPQPISPLIPVQLTIRRVNVEGDWLVYAHLSSDGFVEIICNDDELARKFYEDILSHSLAPEDVSPIAELGYEWTDDVSAVEGYHANITSALGWYFGKAGKEASPKLKELHLTYKRFLRELPTARG